MTIPDWDAYFMNLVKQVSLRSKDRSTQVGCVIVGPDNEIRTTGYNGFPRGINDDRPERHERPAKYLWTEHAERNAIYNAARCGIALKGCRAYLAWFPCMDCARALVQSGIVELVAHRPNEDDPKWGKEFTAALTLFGETGMEVRYVE
jgi:dCMP deaminase